MDSHILNMQFAQAQIEKALGLNQPPKPKPRLTPMQKKALEAYRFAEAQEDRYMGSVFVNAHGQRKAQERTRQAYERCKALGMTHEHGL